MDCHEVSGKCLFFTHFKSLWQLEPISASYAVIVAAAFGRVNFLLEAARENLLSETDLQNACSIAVINKDNQLLKALWDLKKTQTFNKAQHPRVQTVNYSPLFWAVRHGNTEAVAYLLATNALLPTDKEDYLALAVRCDHINIVNLLIQHQAPLSVEALEAAASRNNDVALIALLKAGANALEKNKEGITPLAYVMMIQYVRKLKRSSKKLNLMQNMLFYLKK